jgi:hypothetical protein
VVGIVRVWSRVIAVYSLAMGRSDAQQDMLVERSRVFVNACRLLARVYHRLVLPRRIVGRASHAKRGLVKQRRLLPLLGRVKPAYKAVVRRV